MRPIAIYLIALKHHIFQAMRIGKSLTVINGFIEQTSHQFTVFCYPQYKKLFIIKIEVPCCILTMKNGMANT